MIFEQKKKKKPQLLLQLGGWFQRKRKMWLADKTLLHGRHCMLHAQLQIIKPFRDIASLDI